MGCHTMSHADNYARVFESSAFFYLEIFVEKLTVEATKPFVCLVGGFRITDDVDLAFVLDLESGTIVLLTKEIAELLLIRCQLDCQVEKRIFWKPCLHQHL